MERQLLTRVNKDTAEALGTYYMSLGFQLKNRATNLADGERHAARMRWRRRTANQVTGLVERELANGVRLQDAVDHVAARFGWVGGEDPADRYAWTPDRVRAVWESQHGKPKRRRARRDLLILRLAARPGWTNVRLGRRFKLAPETISRIISRMLDQAGPRRIARPAAAAELRQALP